MKIQIKVITKASCNKVEKIDDVHYKVKVTTAPEKGKANKKVIDILSEYFNVSKSKINIIKGQTIADKFIEIQT
ncbi:MAG: DUF167 domain-containing protein [Patescibacteria group bacterium]